MTSPPPCSVTARPPTPPKEKALDDAYDSFIDLMGTGSHLPNPAQSLETPPPSSSPNAKQSAASPYRKSLRKIRFVAEPVFSSDDAYPTDYAEDRPMPLRALPPSKYQKSQKSILKRQSRHDGTSVGARCSPFDPNDYPDETWSHSTASIQDLSPTKMLQHAILNLRNGVYASRTDAYMSLSRSFKAFRNEPNRQAMAAQLPQFEVFLRRDLAATSPVTDGPDAKLIGVALKLTANLLLESAFARRLSDEFVKYLMDASIQSIEDPTMPKEVVKNQMYLITLERFLNRALDKAKALRILDALTKIHERISGRSVLVMRIGIIQKFYTFAGPALVARPSAWIAPIFHAMMSDLEPLRDSAIHAAGLCATAFGRTKAVTLAVKSFFEEQSLGEGTNFDVFCTHIKALLETKQDVLHVPRLYSTVILFMRGPNSQVAEWSRLNEWLRLFQTCLNGSNHGLHRQALVAWNHMIFATSPSRETSPRLRNALTAPIISVMQRRPNSPEILQTRTAALSTYSLLLYYAFRPPNTPEQFDTFWSEYVVDLITNIHIQKQSDLVHIGRIFSSLLRTSKLNLWETGRYSRTHDQAVAAEEVPRLDSSRIRRNTASALSVIETLAAAQVKLQYEGDLLLSVWSDLLWAIAEAGRRDIKLSSESKRSLADILNFLIRFVSMPTLHGSSKRKAVESLCYMAQAIKSSLGPGVLVENIFVRRADGTLEPASSVAKAGDESRQLDAALPTVFQLVSSLSMGQQLSNECQVSIGDLASSCTSTLSTRSARLQLMRACVDATTSTGSSHCEIWKILTSRTLTHVKPYPGERNDHLWADYRNVYEILHAGARLEGSVSCAQGSALLRTWINVAKEEAGDGGVLLSVVRPVALCISEGDACPQTSLAWATVLLESSLMKPTAKMMDSSKRILFANDRSHTDAAEDDWFSPLVGMISSILKLVASSANEAHEQAQKGLQAIGCFASSSLLLSAERYIEGSLAAWMAFCKASWPPVLKDASANCWSKNVVLLKHTTWPSSNGPVHSAQANLLIAGFSSTSKPIALATIELWNLAYSSRTISTFPSHLQRVLDRLQTVAHLQVDRGMSVKQSDGVQESFTAAELQDCFSWLNDADKASSAGSKETDNAPSPVQFPKAPAHFATPVKRTSMTTEETPRRTVGNPTKTRSKLAHEDSQLTFVPIDSSPGAMELQMMTDHQQEVHDRQKVETRRLRSEESQQSFEARMHSPANAWNSISDHMQPPVVAVGGLDGADGIETYDLPESSPLPLSQHSPKDAEAGLNAKVNTASEVELEAAPLATETRASPRLPNYEYTLLETTFADRPPNPAPASDDAVYHDAQSQNSEPDNEGAVDGMLVPSSVDVQGDTDPDVTTVEDSLLQTEYTPNGDGEAEVEVTVKDSFVAPQASGSRVIRARMQESGSGTDSQRNLTKQTSASVHNESLPKQEARRSTRRQSALLTMSKQEQNIVPVAERTKKSKRTAETAPGTISIKKRKHSHVEPSTRQRRQVSSHSSHATQDLVISDEPSMESFKDLYNKKRRGLRSQSQKSGQLGVLVAETKSRASVRASSTRNAASSNDQESPPSRRSNRIQSTYEARSSRVTASQTHEHQASPLTSLRKTRQQTLMCARSQSEDAPSSRLRTKRKGANSDFAQGSERKRARIVQNGHDGDVDTLEPSLVASPSPSFERGRNTRSRLARFRPRPAVDATAATTSSKLYLAKETSSTAIEASDAAEVEVKDVAAAVPSTPNRTTAEASVSPPSSQRFRVRMSETAHRVIQSLRDAFVAAQELVLGPQQQAQADVMEDLQIELQSELARAKRDGRRKERAK